MFHFVTEISLFTLRRVLSTNREHRLPHHALSGRLQEVKNNGKRWYVLKEDKFSFLYEG